MVEKRKPLSTDQSREYQAGVREVDRELTAQDLEVLLSSNSFGERLRTLYSQVKEGGVPLWEQAFYANKPRGSRVYISQLQQIAMGATLEASGNRHSLKSFLRWMYEGLKYFDLNDLPMAVVAHTHPTWSVSPSLTGRQPMIIPSAFAEEIDKGDLYVFRQMQREFQDRFVRRPIQLIIVQEMRTDYPIEFLMVQESEGLVSQDDEQVIAMLKEAQRGAFRSAQSQEEVLYELTNLGYHALHFAFSDERFVAPGDIFTSEQLQMVRELFTS